MAILVHQDSELQILNRACPALIDFASLVITPGSFNLKFESVVIFLNNYKSILLIPPCLSD